MSISTKDNTRDAIMLLELGISEDGYEFASDIKTAIASAELELSAIASKLNESTSTLKKLTPECDKTDYILAACSGAICGVMDIFLVGKPGESPVGDVTDKWFENRTMDFAKMCGWDDSNNNSLSAAIKHLEKKFKIPYDQRGAGDAASWVFDLSPKNHHFKSLGHNPTLLGLFFSILDQFTNTSHYKIDLDDKDKKLLWKSLRKNKKMLKSMDISKKEFDMDIMNAILEALKYKYQSK